MPDALLEEAKRTAQSEGVTLRALLEAGLRSELSRRKAPAAFTLRKAGFEGKGLRPEFAEVGWDRIRDAVYEGHGA